MFEHARRWAKENDYAIFHLGGGVTSAADSLFEFKAGFSKIYDDYHTFRMILDNQLYDVLNQRWREQNTEARNAGDFFPMYRAPLGTMPVSTITSLPI